jgi:hypothetical protein
MKPENISMVFIEPMLAVAVRKLPEGAAWSYELKFDGYRALGMKTDDKVRLLSRNGKDFTKRFAMIAVALERLPDETVIDGEIIAYGADGRPSFNVPQNLARRRVGTPPTRLRFADAPWQRRGYPECACHHRGPAERSNLDSGIGDTITSCCVDDMSDASVGSARCV